MASPGHAVSFWSELFSLCGCGSMSSGAAAGSKVRGTWLWCAFLVRGLTPVADRKESYYEPRMAPNILEGHRIDADIVLQESEREAVAELLGWSSRPY